MGIAELLLRIREEIYRDCTLPDLHRESAGSDALDREVISVPFDRHHPASEGTYSSEQQKAEGLESGDFVFVVGITSDSSINNIPGMVLCYFPDADRWQVRCFDVQHDRMRDVLVKSVNVRKMTTEEVDTILRDKYRLQTSSVAQSSRSSDEESDSVYPDEHQSSAQGELVGPSEAAKCDNREALLERLAYIRIWAVHSAPSAGTKHEAVKLLEETKAWLGADHSQEELANKIEALDQFMTKLVSDMKP